MASVQYNNAFFSGVVSMAFFTNKYVNIVSVGEFHTFFNPFTKTSLNQIVDPAKLYADTSHIVVEDRVFLDRLDFTIFVLQRYFKPTNTYYCDLVRDTVSFLGSLEETPDISIQKVAYDVSTKYPFPTFDEGVYPSDSTSDYKNILAYDTTMIKLPETQNYVDDCKYNIGVSQHSSSIFAFIQRTVYSNNMYNRLKGVHSYINTKILEQCCTNDVFKYLYTVNTESAQLIKHDILSYNIYTYQYIWVNFVFYLCRFINKHAPVTSANTRNARIYGVVMYILNTYSVEVVKKWSDVTYRICCSMYDFIAVQKILDLYEMAKSTNSAQPLLIWTASGATHTMGVNYILTATFAAIEEVTSVDTYAVLNDVISLNTQQSTIVKVSHINDVSGLANYINSHGSKFGFKSSGVFMRDPETATITRIRPIYEADIVDVYPDPARAARALSDLKEAAANAVSKPEKDFIDHMTNDESILATKTMDDWLKLLPQVLVPIVLHLIDASNQNPLYHIYAVKAKYTTLFVPYRNADDVAQINFISLEKTMRNKNSIYFADLKDKFLFKNLKSNEEVFTNDPLRLGKPYEQWYDADMQTCRITNEQFNIRINYSSRIWAYYINNTLQYPATIVKYAPNVDFSKTTVWQAYLDHYNSIKNKYPDAKKRQLNWINYNKFEYEDDFSYSSPIIPKNIETLIHNYKNKYEYYKHKQVLLDYVGKVYAGIKNKRRAELIDARKINPYAELPFTDEYDNLYKYYLENLFYITTQTKVIQPYTVNGQYVFDGGVFAPFITLPIPNFIKNAKSGTNIQYSITRYINTLNLATHPTMIHNLQAPQSFNPINNIQPSQPSSQNTQSLLQGQWKTWIFSQQGQQWLQGKNGQTWLGNPEGQAWLQSLLQVQSPHGQAWLQSQQGQAWLQDPEGQAWLQWINSPSGKQWLAWAQSQPQAPPMGQPSYQQPYPPPSQLQPSSSQGPYPSPPPGLPVTHLTMNKNPNPYPTYGGVELSPDVLKSIFNFVLLAVLIVVFLYLVCQVTKGIAPIDKYEKNKYDKYYYGKNKYGNYAYLTC